MNSLSFTEYVTLGIYLSILVEIILFPVPSVASTYRLAFGAKQVHSGGFLKGIRAMHPMLKVLVLVLPATIGTGVYCFPLLVIMLEESFSGWREFLFLQNQVAGIGGILLAVAGRLLSFYAVRFIRQHKDRRDQETYLVTTGIYAYSRNPILLGMHCTFLGLLLLYPYRVMAWSGVVYLLNMHLRVLLEEDFLAYRFGEEYERYRKRTNRYV